MIVTGDPVEIEQRLAVRAPLSLLQTALGTTGSAGRTGKTPTCQPSYSARRLPAGGPAARGSTRAMPRDPEFSCPPINHLSEAARIPQKRSSTFPIKLPRFKLPRSTGSIATQFQSHLELLPQLD